jgi:uncharacterized phosphosugar-binding protein
VNAYQEFVGQVQALVSKVASEEEVQIRRAAIAMADEVARDQLIRVIGTGGHSFIGAEEAFMRAGGLASIDSILDSGFSLQHGAALSSAVERTPGYATAVLSAWGIPTGGLMLIVNAYGINAATIDTACYCRDHGITSIALTSVELQRALPLDHVARHPSRLNLCDLATIVIDTKVPMGDVLLALPGVSQKVGAVSTVINALVVQLLVIETATELTRRGIVPPIWQSGNSPGGDEANQDLLAKYQPRVRMS